MRYVYDGQKVIATIDGKRLLCLVACAMGNTARIVNELHGVDTWIDVGDLRPAPSSEVSHA